MAKNQRPVLSCKAFLKGQYWVHVFLSYKNDMPGTIKSKIRLFADDTIMYLTVSNQSDCQDLQSDLSTCKVRKSRKQDDSCKPGTYLPF